MDVQNRSRLSQQAPHLLTVMALRVAMGETSAHAIAERLALALSDVHEMSEHPLFEAEVARVAPEAPIQRRSLEQRLESYAHDALDVLAKEMRHGAQERTRVATASKILDARNAAKTAGRTSNNEGVVLPTDVLSLILETPKQTE